MILTGVIFFEMCYTFSTGMQRAIVCFYLSYLFFVQKKSNLAANVYMIGPSRVKKQ